jgi:hypothetical protein
MSWWYNVVTFEKEKLMCGKTEIVPSVIVVNVPKQTPQEKVDALLKDAAESTAQSFISKFGATLAPIICVHMIAQTLSGTGVYADEPESGRKFHFAVLSMALEKLPML